MATTLYTLASCPHSRAMRDELLRRDVAFVEIDLEARPECVAELIKLTRKRRIVPVLVDGARIEIAPDGGTEF